MAENVVGILNEAGSHLGEIGLEVIGGTEIVMVEETLVDVENEEDRGVKTVVGQDGTLVGADSEIRAAVIATEEISHRVVEMEEDLVVMREIGMIVAAMTAIGALAGVATETAAVETEIMTEIAGTEPAAIETARRTAPAATDPTSPAETSDVMTSQNEALDGVHRRMLSRLSHSMFHHPNPFLGLHQIRASYSVLQK